MTTHDGPAEPAESDRRPELRIGDREREAAVAHLGVAFAEGRLELAEYDERLASAYGAKTASDLLHLTADLPLATREKPASSAALANKKARPTNLDGVRAPARRDAADPYPPWLRRLWLVYAGVVAINLVIWLLVGVSNSANFPYFWPMWVAGPWGVILLVRTFGSRIIAPDR